MAKARSIELLLNDDDHDHKAEIVNLFQKAKRLECLVAFAKHSVWADIKKPLKEALANGMQARFAIGLNFYHTDPDLLDELWRLRKKYNVELYLGTMDSTFHPKIYAFQRHSGCKLVIGSANFTRGGLTENYEASVLIDDPSGAMMSSVIEHFEVLIEEKVIVRASKARIDLYAKEYEINKMWARFGKRKADRAIATGKASLDALSKFLELMKEGGVNSDFEVQLKNRRDNLAQAPVQLRSIANWQGKSEHDFLTHFNSLIAVFHSGGLARAKTRIARKRSKFSNAVAAIVEETVTSPRAAFALLHSHFEEIKGAGINLLTEILHALDNKRFAVINQNSISGLRLAGYDSFPLHPSKDNVNADSYQLYCDQAESVRTALELDDFTELDALFNYVYWHGDNVDDDD